MNAWRKKILFTFIALLLTLSVAEGICALFFHIYRDRFSFYNFSDYLIDTQTAHALAEAYDRELGWKKLYNTPHGERPRPVYYKDYFMAVWGDSFTHCDQVNDNETWETYLAAKAQKNVINFGVGGYGTGQAYLNFKRNWPKVKTRVAALCLVPENISRVANVYRKFYFPRTGGPITKPRFILKNGKLTLLPNPIQSPDELINLTDPRFLEKIGKNDFWYNRDDYPVFGFPYLRILFNQRFWLEVEYMKGDKRVDDMIARPTYYNDIWASPEADVLFAIFDAFVRDAREMGTEPIIAVLPTKFEAEYRFNSHQHHDAVKKIIAYCQKKGYRIFDGVAGMADRATTRAELDSYFSGHASPLGNRLLADAFFGYLVTEGLLPSGQDSAQ